MRKKYLDNLLNKNIITEEEYNTFFKTMHFVPGDNDRIEGMYPPGELGYKYFLNGNMLGDVDIRILLMDHVVPPLGIDEVDNTFFKYGFSSIGVGDDWKWYTRDNITAKAISVGHAPIEDASELECWKMIAISERYWKVFYNHMLDDRQENLDESYQIHKKLKQWVNENYDSRACGYTVERSRGNCDDVFYDGDAYGTSWSAYYVGRILGMDLPAPVQYDEDE